MLSKILAEHRLSGSPGSRQIGITRSASSNLRRFVWRLVLYLEPLERFARSVIRLRDSLRISRFALLVNFLSNFFLRPNRRPSSTNSLHPGSSALRQIPNIRRLRIRKQPRGLVPLKKTEKKFFSKYCGVCSNWKTGPAESSGTPRRVRRTT